MSEDLVRGNFISSTSYIPVEYTGITKPPVLSISRGGQVVNTYYKGPNSLPQIDVPVPTGALIIKEENWAHSPDIPIKMRILGVIPKRICWGPSSEEIDKYNSPYPFWIGPGKIENGPFCRSEDSRYPHKSLKYVKEFNPNQICNKKTCPLARGSDPSNPNDRGGVQHLVMPEYDIETGAKTKDKKDILAGATMRCVFSWHVYCLVEGYQNWIYVGNESEIGDTNNPAFKVYEGKVYEIVPGGCVDLVLSGTRFMTGKQIVDILRRYESRGISGYKLVFELRTRTQSRGPHQWSVFEPVQYKLVNISPEIDKYLFNRAKEVGEFIRQSIG